MPMPDVDDDEETVAQSHLLKSQHKGQEYEWWIGSAGEARMAQNCE